MRWPSLLLIVGLIGDDSVALAEMQAAVNWRELGLTFGLAYLFAAICFYTTSTLLTGHKRGAVVSYVAGLMIGFPPFLLFDFEPGWWQNPDLFEQIVIFAGVLSLFLFGAIWELARLRKPARKVSATSAAQPELVLNQRVRLEPVNPDIAKGSMPTPKKRYRQPVPAAIARQRASFAYHGRKAKLRLRS